MISGAAALGACRNNPFDFVPKKGKQDYSVRHEQNLPELRFGAALVVTARFAGVAAGGPLGVVHQRRGGRVGSESDRAALREWRRARAAAVPSADDGEAAGLRVLHWQGVVAQDRAGDVRARGVSGIGVQSASGSRQHRELSPTALAGVGEVVRASAANV